MKYIFVFSISLIGLFFLFLNTYLFFTNKIVMNKVPKVFLSYLVSFSFFELFCNIYGFLYPNTNLFLTHIYFCSQFIFISILYYKLIDHYYFKKLIVVIGISQMAYLLFIYFNNLKLFWLLNTYEIVSSSSFLAVYATFYVLKNLEFKHRFYYFSIGLFFYLMCSITIFLSGQIELVLCEKPYIDIWVFNSLFYILFQYFIYKEYLFLNQKIVRLL